MTLRNLMVLTLLVFWGSLAQAQKSQVVVSPSQPTTTDSPDTIAPGVLEVETGGGRAWPGQGVHNNSLGVMLKIGLFPNFELRNFFDGWQSQSGPRQPLVNGIGDDWITGQYRFMHETHLLPTAAIHYTLKVPTAGVGFGSGAMDHIVAISAGKTVKHTSVNFETKWVLLGQLHGGFNSYEEYSTNFTHSLTQHTAITGEVYGDTKSPGTPAFGSNLWSLSYSVNPRLVFDTGIDIGFTRGAPNKRLFMGITYAIGDVYRGLRSHRNMSKGRI